MGEGSRKCSSFKLCFNLNDNQLKSSRYSYRSTYMNLKVTKNPQQIHTHTKKKNREKRAQAHHQRKSSNHKGRNQKKERTEKNDKNREQVTK